VTFTYLLQLLEDGVVLGAIYGLIAIGYTMVYGIVQLINFAHGDIFMLGGFASLAVYAWVTPLQHISVWLALPVMLAAGVLTSVLAAVGAERFAYRPLRTAPRLAPLITAIGLSIAIEQFVRLVYPVHAAGGVTYGVGAPVAFPGLPGRAFSIGGVLIQRADVFTVGVAIVCMAALSLYVKRSRTGRAMRATAQDPDTARLMGIDTDKVIVAAFALGGALAAVACLTQGLHDGQLSFDMGFLAGLKAFTAAVLGGIGDINGAMLGGVVLGVVQSLATGGLVKIPVLAQYGGGAWQDVWAFVVLILVLLIRPQGLLGRRVTDRA